MNAYLSARYNDDYNGGYIDIGDDGHQAERRLFIEDDDGNKVVIKNEQIKTLYQLIKPPMSG